jgi:hypothetical protein
VAEQFLDGPDVVAILEEVGSERVAQGMAGGGLGDAWRKSGAADGSLDYRLVKEMASALARWTTNVGSGGWEDPLPRPFPLCVGVLEGEGVW